MNSCDCKNRFYAVCILAKTGCKKPAVLKVYNYYATFNNSNRKKATCSVNAKLTLLYPLLM